MINTIRISGFQSHLSTILELSPGVNYIVGPSDSGKSAVIRALRWLWVNRPLGNAFVSSSSEKGECLVALETDSFLIERIQTKSKNVYRINDQEYKAFGQNPPQQVLDLLGWDAVNIQFQRDQGFLLSESPARVSAYLNSLVGLDVVDSAVKKITSSIRALSAQEKAKREQAAELENRLASFPDLELAEQWVEKADKLQRSVSWNLKRADWIVETVEIANEQAELIRFNSSILGQVDYDKLAEANGRLGVLGNRLKILMHLNGLQEQALSALTKQVPAEIGDGGLSAILAKRHRLDRLCGLDTEQKAAAAAMKSLSRQIMEFDRQLREKFPEVCPLCDQPILVK